MRRTSWQWRSGFLGIELLVMLIIFVFAGAIVETGASPTTAPSSRPSEASIPVTGTAKAVSETVRAAAAVDRMAQSPDVDQPATEGDQPADAPSPDVTDEGSDFGTSVGDLLDSIFDNF